VETKVWEMGREGRREGSNLKHFPVFKQLKNPRRLLRVP